MIDCLGVQLRGKRRIAGSTSNRLHDGRIRRVPEGHQPGGIGQSVERAPDVVRLHEVVHADIARGQLRRDALAIKLVEIAGQNRLAALDGQSLLKNPVPEQCSAGTKLQVTGKRKDGLEGSGHPVANLAGRMREGSQTNRDIGYHLRGRCSGAIDNDDVGLRNQQHAVEEGQHDDPLPEVLHAPLAGEDDQCQRENPDQCQGAQKTQVVAASHEGGDGVERGRQFLDIPVGIDLEIHRCECVVLSAYRLNAIID